MSHFRILSLLLYIGIYTFTYVSSVGIVHAAATNEPVNTLPITSTNQPTASFLSDLRTFLNGEDAARYFRMFQGFIYSGGLHPTAAGMTSGSFATEAFDSSGNRISQSAAAINYTTQGAAANDVCWTFISSRTETTIDNFTRVTGTDYFVDCTSATQPSTFTASIPLMRITITTSAIAAVQDIRQDTLLTDAPINALSPLFGVQGDCATDDTAGLQAAINNAGTRGLPLHVPRSQKGACYLFTRLWLGIKKYLMV